MSNISYPKGNLFDSHLRRLLAVNCVIMGKGIALEYKLYPEMRRIQKLCDRGQIEIGNYTFEAQTGKKY